MRIRVLLHATFLASCASLSVGWSQVNIEPIRAELEKAGSTLHLRGSISGRSGNTDAIAMGAGSLFGVRGERNLFYATASLDYARHASQTNVEKAFAHTRYNRLLWERVWGELFAQIETDRFRRVSARELFGVGPRFDLVTSETFTLIFGTSYMLELTQRNDSVTTDRRLVHHRWNNYGSINYRPHPGITLSETFYFQPRFDDAGDHWLLSLFAARFEVTDRLSSHADLGVRRESRVPDGVERNDVEVTSGFSLTF